MYVLLILVCLIASGVAAYFLYFNKSKKVDAKTPSGLNPTLSPTGPLSPTGTNLTPTLSPTGTNVTPTISPTGSNTPALAMPTLKKARYVKLRRNNITTDNYLNVEEIEVYGENGVQIDSSTIEATLDPKYGVELNSDGTVKDDSWYRNSWNPKFLIDGIVRGPGAGPTGLPHTASSNSGYMQLDLKSDKPITKVIIKNRVGSNQDRMIGTILELIDSSGKTILSKDVTTINAIYTFEQKQNTSGDYVLDLTTSPTLVKKAEHVYYDPTLSPSPSPS